MADIRPGLATLAALEPRVPCAAQLARQRGSRLPTSSNVARRNRRKTQGRSVFAGGRRRRRARPRPSRAGRCAKPAVRLVALGRDPLRDLQEQIWKNRARWDPRWLSITRRERYDGLSRSSVTIMDYLDGGVAPAQTTACTSRGHLGVALQTRPRSSAVARHPCQRPEPLHHGARAGPALRRGPRVLVRAPHQLGLRRERQPAQGLQHRLDELDGARNPVPASRTAGHRAEDAAEHARSDWWAAKLGARPMGSTRSPPLPGEEGGSEKTRSGTDSATGGGSSSGVSS